MKRKMFLAGSVALVAISATLPAAGQPVVGPKRIVTYGPWAKPVNEPAVAAEKTTGDRRVVLWSIEDQFGAPLEVGYATWDSESEEWVEQGTLPFPGGSVTEASPFVTVSGDVFIAGAISFDSQNDPTAYTIRMESGSNQFDPATLVHFSGCEVDYPGIGIGPTFESGTRTTLLQRVVTGGGGCGELGQIALRDSSDEGETWDAHEPIDVNGTEILGFASPPRVVVGGDMYFAYSTLLGEFVRATVDPNGQGGNLDPEDLGLDETRVLSAGQNETYFEAADAEIAGLFEVGPFTSVAAPSPGEVFIMYGDAASPVGGDLDFNIYLLHGVDQGQTWDWSDRIQVNGGPSGGKYDSFMGRMTSTNLVGTGVVLHAAYYDTRNDPVSSQALDVELSLYYAYSLNLGQTWTEIELDEIAIDTAYLDNPQFIGDHLDITELKGGSGEILVTYMGTRHSLAGFYSMTPEPEFDTNEAIFSITITH